MHTSSKQKICLWIECNENFALLELFRESKVYVVWQPNVPIIEHPLIKKILLINLIHLQSCGKTFILELQSHSSPGVILKLDPRHLLCLVT